MFSKSNPLMTQLVVDMLNFNPFFRPTAKECLQNKLFDKIRVQGLEASAPFKINIDVDRNEFKYNYESETNEKDVDQE